MPLKRLTSHFVETMGVEPTRPSVRKTAPARWRPQVARCPRVTSEYGECTRPGSVDSRGIGPRSSQCHCDVFPLDDEPEKCATLK